MFRIDEAIRAGRFDCYSSGRHRAFQRRKELPLIVQKNENAPRIHPCTYKSVARLRYRGSLSEGAIKSPPVYCTGHWRSCTEIQRLKCFRNPIRRVRAAHQRVGGSYYRTRAPEAVGERVGLRIWIVDNEILNAGWRCVAKGIHALVIITSDEGDHSSCDQLVYELLVDRVEILKFVHYQMLRVTGSRFPARIC